MKTIQENKPLAGRGLIDCHAHILPDIDDGARNIEESICLLKMAYSNGIRTIYCTPHYHAQRSNLPVKEKFKEFLNEVQKQVPDLMEQMDFFLGHELVYHIDLPQRLSCGEAFTMSDSDKILIEFPPYISYNEMFRQLRTLINCGYTPIIAHMERYSALKNTANIYELKNIGCLLQVNFHSIIGSSIDNTKPKFYSIMTPSVLHTRNLIKTGVIDLFGTDMHRIDYRPPQINKSIQWLYRNKII